MADLISIMAEGTMRASARIMNEPGNLAGEVAQIKGLGENQYSAMAGAMRQTIKANLPAYQQEWKDAIEAHMPESVLRQIVNAQCIETAIESIRMVAEEVRR